MSDFENTFREEIEKAYNHGKVGALFDVDLSMYKAIASMQGEAVEYQIKILGERWAHCAKHTYNPSNPNTRALFTYPPSAASKIAEQDARIKELEQQLEVTRKDAERYQWLRENGSANSKKSGVVLSKNELKALMSFRYWAERAELDAAIDAAIRQIGGAE